ncbi:MAG: hypothetical protein NTU62_12215 [Spirochaetes bacterium]|nr:hypothetical protein [Spirochaetota bacterium]
MPEKEAHVGTGYELVQAMLGAFAEVVTVMNLCMQVKLEAKHSVPRIPIR